MNLQELSTILAALLHDVGKFYRRAWRIGPHWELSGKFVKEFIPEFEYKQHVQDLVIHHHESRDNEDIEVIRKADHLSAKEREGDLSGEREWRGEYRKLKHIFSDGFFYKIAPLDLCDFKNLAGTPQSESTHMEYQKLWELFTNNVRRLSNFYDGLSLDNESTMRAYIMNMLELLKTYTFFIPSAPAIEFEVKNSLYAHLKTTAAIASSMIMNRKIGGKESLRNEFTLIMGDIAGIQRYVYGSRSYTGALKMLRSRSIYVSLLTEAIARHIVNELGLLPLNIIFCSGGHFMIISHRIEKGELERIITQIERFLAKEHQGNIGLKLSGTQVTEQDFEDRRRFLMKIKEARSKLSSSGLTLFKGILEEYHKEIFGPILIPPEGDVCYSCGSTRDITRFEDASFCEVCNSMRDLAKMLAKAEYVVVVSWNDSAKKSVIKEISEIREGIYTSPLDFVSRGLPCSFHIISDSNNLASFFRLLEGLDSDIRELHVMRINDSFLSEEFSADLEKIARGYVPIMSSFGSKFLARHTPLSDERKHIEDFDELAKRSKGSKMIGYLKLDIDGLGDRFVEEASERLADMITFSEIISFTMEGVVDYLLSQYLREEYGDRLYLVYSGGDDLFIVGSWNAVIESLEKIYHELDEILRINSGGPTLSAAFHLEDPRTPVKIASEIISAKLRKVKEEGKNGLIISRRKLSWDGFRECLAVSKELTSYVEKGLIPRNLIFDLSRLIGDYEMDPEKTWSIYRYRLKYILARNIDKSLSGRLENKLIKDLGDVIQTNELKEKILRNFIRLADIVFLVKNYIRVGGVYE